MFTTGHFTCFIGAVPLIAALAACIPTPTEPDGDCSGASCSGQDSGALSAEALTLTWQPGATWEGGRCVDLTIANQGRPVEWWMMVVEVSGEIETWLSSAGGTLSGDGNEVTIQPTGETYLDYGDSVEMQYCAEPSVNPVEIKYVDLAELGPTPESVADSIQAGELLLSYQSAGSSNNGYCLDMTLTNLSASKIASWELLLYMADSVRITDYWGYIAIGGGSTIQLYPGPGMETIEARGSRTGTVCTDPMSEPVSMVPTIDYEEDE